MSENSYIKEECFDSNFESTLNVNASGDFSVGPSSQYTHFGVVCELGLAELNDLGNVKCCLLIFLLLIVVLLLLMTEVVLILLILVLHWSKQIFTVICHHLPTLLGMHNASVITFLTVVTRFNATSRCVAVG